MGFLCLFGGLTSHSRIFHSDGNVIVTSGGLQILTYTWHSWPLSSGCSFPCHTLCDMGKNGYLQNRVHDTRICCRAFGIGAITILSLYLRLRSVANGDRTLIVRMRGERYTNWATAAVQNMGMILYDIIGTKTFCHIYFSCTMTKIIDDNL